MKHLSNNNFLEDNKQKIKILERKKKDNTWFNRTQRKTLEKEKKKECN